MTTQTHIQQTPKSICILGGSGFVGSHLCARLARDGHRITVPSRHPQRHQDLEVLPTVRVVDSNIHDRDALVALLEGHDVVINLVGILNADRKGHGFYRAHFELPRTVTEACQKAGIRRLLHMSALGADAAEGASHYQRSKGEGENLVHSAIGMDVTSFRPSVIFGPGDSFFNRFGDLLALTPGVFPLACGDARFAPVFVGDVVEAYTRALDNPGTYGQRFDLCGPHEYTLTELVQYAAKVKGLSRWVVPLPDSLSRLQARILEHVPGKPFSMDNYHSMQRDNVCQGPFPALFGIKPHSIESIVPGYLGSPNRSRRNDLYRSRRPQE